MIMELEEIYNIAHEFITQSGEFDVIECDKNSVDKGYIYLCRGAVNEEEIKNTLEELFEDSGYRVKVTVNDFNFLYLFDYYEFSVQFELDNDDTDGWLRSYSLKDME